MYQNKRIAAIILARKGSNRLKDKMLLPLGNKKVVETVIDRIKMSKLIDDFVLATSLNSEDLIFENIAKAQQLKFFRGSENDIVSRMVNSLDTMESKPDIIVRVCSDNPFIMPTLVDEGIRLLIDSKADVITPFKSNTYPFGYSLVVMTRDCLEKIDRMAKDSIYREHVENFCFSFPDSFEILYQKAPRELCFPELRLTLDYESDYARLKKINTLMEKIPIEEQPRELIEIVKKQKDLVI